jgi:ADP-ribose pyrophosphatase YjhB (NUDIX family)
MIGIQGDQGKMSLIDESWYVRPQHIRESVSAGGIVARLEAGRVWVALVREGDFPEYLLPKGRVELGESIEAAARREIEEEAGLSDLKLVDYLGQRQRLNYRRDRWITVHYFLFQTNQREAAPTDPDHVYTCEWFPLDALPAFFWPEQRGLVLATLPRLRVLFGMKS